MNESQPIMVLIVQISRKALWAPLAVIVVHILAGDWFGHEPYVDPVMHFSGGVAAAYFFWQSATLAQDRVGRQTLLGLGLIAFGLASAMAVVWEFGEFLSDTFRETQMQLSVANTMRDLFLGLAGASVFVVARWFSVKIPISSVPSN